MGNKEYYGRATIAVRQFSRNIAEFVAYLQLTVIAGMSGTVTALTVSRLTTLGPFVPRRRGRRILLHESQAARHLLAGRDAIKRMRRPGT
jgi:hypothetical protein